jgi:hypothetical protein
MQARTLAQHLFEIGRATVLLQQVAKGFVSQLLEGFHAVEREPVQSLPGLAVEGDPLADLT